MALTSEWTNVEILPDRDSISRMVTWCRNSKSILLTLHYIMVPQWSMSADIYWSDSRKALAVIFKKKAAGAFRLRPWSRDRIALPLTKIFKRIPAKPPPIGESDALFTHEVIGDNRALIVYVKGEDE